MSKKVDKLPPMSDNPSTSHEHVQILRVKINEIISVLNGESIVSSKSDDEILQDLKSQLASAAAGGEVDRVRELITKITAVQKDVN